MEQPKQTLEQYIKIGQEKFHLSIQVANNVKLNNLNIIETQEKEIDKVKKGKWADFAERMSGLTNANITKHIKKTHEEIKESFQFRDLELNK